MVDFSALKLLLQRFEDLKLGEAVDYEKFSQYAITHHSTFLEGSTLTENETFLLLDENLTPAGKPLQHSLMTKNQYETLKEVVRLSMNKEMITERMIKRIGGLVLKDTESIYNTLLGVVDSRKGEYRKGNVRAGNRYFVTFNKVPKLMSQLCKKVNEHISKVNTIEEKLILAFDLHFDLVSIHPFYDGNGRTSRLMMNFIQQYFGLPLSTVFKEDKAAYFDALEKSRTQESMIPFRSFMVDQYVKHLKKEVDGFLDVNGKGPSNYSFIF